LFLRGSMFALMGHDLVEECIDGDDRIREVSRIDFSQTKHLLPGIGG
jgi:hypothetical protein